MNSSIIRKIYRVKDIENIQNKLNLLGSNRKIKFDAVGFLNTRLITTILLALLLILFSNIQYFIIPFILIIYYNLFYYFLITDPINKRIKTTQKNTVKILFLIFFLLSFFIILSNIL